MADWFSLGAAGISGLANLFGGFTSASGQQQANSQNIQFQREQNQMDSAFQNRTNQDNRDFSWAMNEKNMANAREMFERNQAATSDQNAFNANEAEKARGFFSDMSSTAYQRATKDMRAAGLNPILAYQQGGSSTPGGPAASGSAASGSAPTGSAPSGSASRGTAPTTANSQEELGRAVGRIASTAIDAWKSTEQGKLIGSQNKTEEWRQTLVDEQGRLTREQKHKTNAEIDNTKSQNDVIKAQADMVRAQAGAARARASVDAETARQYAKNGLPGYGLGERVIRSLGDMSPGPVKLPESSWPFNN